LHWTAATHIALLHTWDEEQFEVTVGVLLVSTVLPVQPVALPVQYLSTFHDIASLEQAPAVPEQPVLVWLSHTNVSG
jgi:hypothetical protein